jgi:hypothetical protein
VGTCVKCRFFNSFAPANQFIKKDKEHFTRLEKLYAKESKKKGE